MRSSRSLPLRPLPSPLKHGVHAKRLTIALGILATDRVVLAADSRITAGSDKWSQGKVSLHEKSMPTSGVASRLLIAGGGGVSGIEHVREHLSKSFNASDVPMSADRGRSELESQAPAFHKKHLTKHGRGDEDLVLAACSL